MGARANCVIIEQGQRAIYYDSWAASKIPALLLSQPQGTLAKIRHMAPRDQLTDTVWAEGGLVVNCDARRVVYWGGERYRLPYIRRYAAPIWQHLWPGWDVTWTVFGQPDIARACGIDPARVIATDFDYHEFLFGDATLPGVEAINAQPTSRSDQRRILSVHFANDTVADYTLGLPDEFAIDAVHGLKPLDLALTLGPALAARLTALTPTTLLREDEYDGGVAIDFPQRQLLVWARFALDGRKLAAFQRRWPNWTITAPADGPMQQMTLLGRDPEPFLVPKRDCLRELFPALIDFLPYVERDASQALLTHTLQTAL